MAPKRNQSINGLSSQNSLQPNPPPSPNSQRSTSPSPFTQFLSKPTKWFQRSVSASKVPTAPAESRPSLSSGARKPKISRPTDPRPILETYSSSPSSKSVLDLSSRQQGSMELPRFREAANPSQPSSPTISSSTGGLGDLRNISKRAWSRSADDLSKISAPVSFTPLKTTFQERVAQYRGRSDSAASALSTASPSSPVNGNHPFPSVAGSPLSSSPPTAGALRTPASRSSTLPTLSASVSTPVIEESKAAKNLSPTHVHTRSHSFTPKLPSKLAVPAYSSLPKKPAPSLKRGDSGDSEKPQAPWGFGFGFGNSSKDSNHSNPHTPVTGRFPGSASVTSPGGQTSANNRATVLLSPPIIIEPQEEETQKVEADNRRASQILLHSGLINRLVDVPSSFQSLSSAKGWKPFKMELKGSKLYFYKPPSDRTNAIKELFPSGLVPPSEEEDEAEEENVEVDGNSEGAARARGREESGTGGGTRKKRAYWGRQGHPDLVLNANGKIVKGTFEALAHEAVFGTTLDMDGTTSQLSLAWNEFASSILLGLPHLVDPLVFEAEFLRCCSYLISGAEDSAKESDRARVAWLANEYLRHHGKPVDPSAWDAWKQETLPNVDLSAEGGLSSSGMPTSASTQALHSTSPFSTPGAEFTTFSPRPENGTAKMVPLLAALNLPTTSASSSPYPSRIPWSAINEEGLTRDILVSLDAQFLAKSLTLFHRSQLEQSPDHLTTELVLPPTEPSSKQSQTPFCSLFGTDDHPHWLTKLLLVQIFGVDTHAPPPPQQLQSPGRKSEDRSNPPAPSSTSRTHSRSEIISVWAKVGELCRRTGDECSWKAIAAALCSRPVARLDKAWRRVDPNALSVVEAWAYPTSEHKTLSVNDPRVTPWGGDLKARLAEEIERAKGEPGDLMMRVEALHKTRSIFEQFKGAFALCPRNNTISEDEATDDLKRMVAFWKEVADGGRTSGLAVKFQRVEQFLSLSLAAECRRKGLFEPLFWQRAQASPPANSVLLPLLFPESLPTQSLVDRAQLVRGRVESDAVEMQQQYLRNNAQTGPHPLQRLDFNPDFTKRLIFGQAGPVISVYNGELLLMVQPGSNGADSRPPSRAPSRPTSSVNEAGGPESRPVSRAPSIRVKPSSSHDLNRKTSVARRSSLPSVPHRQNYHDVISETSTEPPLRVIVQAGSLDYLVNVLVHGLDHITVSVADDNGETALLEGKSRELVVDRTEFSSVWWNTFRSFVTPFVFFELLRKLYITSQPAGSSPPPGEYIYAATRRNEVLSTMKDWLTHGGGAQDVLDDAQLHASVLAFLEGPSDHLVHKAEAFDDSTVRQVWNGLQENHRILKACFSSQSQRPTLSRLHIRKAASATSRRRHTAPKELPDFDRMDPEDFVDNLDGMAYAALHNVTEEDLYITADLLEVQTADRTGWFAAREPPSTEEAAEIQTIYTHFQDIETSALISELSQDALYRELPPGVRSCIRAFTIIRKWLISKIIASRIGTRSRQARMELLLQVVEVARLRNAESGQSGPTVMQPCIRSFVESVVTSAILSVESRIHHRAWQSVALNRGCQFDCIASLLLRPFVQSTSSNDCLTVDMGWLLERMLEIIANPDVVDAPSTEGQTPLINFDKRRHLCNLISQAWSLPTSRKHPPSDEANRRGFERLNNIEKEVYNLHFDHRYIRDEASREASQSSANGPPSSKKAARPFSKTVAQQLEKNRRDKALRSRLQREKALEQNRTERREDLLNRAMKSPRGKPSHSTTSTPSHAQQKQHRNKKSMSAFLNFMRPISTAFGADFLPTSSGHDTSVKRTPAELDFAPSGKPALVVNILDARAAQFINNEKSYTFQLETEDGGHYLLQAYSKKDMNKWLETISKVTHSVAQRRLTYIGSTPKPEIKDHLHDGPVVATRDAYAVFGVELDFLLRREAMGQEILPGTLPRAIAECLAEVEKRGLSEVGIYRIAGAVSEITALKEAYNRGESPITESTDIHAVCDLIKSWFRVLPEPVFPPASYYEVMQAMKIENLDERLLAIRGVVQALPQANFDLLRRVSEHLDKVTDYEEYNQMTVDALAIVFSPNLLRAPQNNFATILNNMGLSHRLVKAFVTHFQAIFEQADAEHDDDGDELEPPILEVDEDDLDDDEEYEQGASHALSATSSTSFFDQSSGSPQQMSSPHSQLPTSSSFGSASNYRQYTLG